MMCERCAQVLAQLQKCRRCGHWLCATCFAGRVSPCDACRHQLELWHDNVEWSIVCTRPAR
jgi:hypothetical protein